MDILSMGMRNTSSLNSTIRYQSNAKAETRNAEIPGTMAKCKMDSHADTCVAGPNFRIIE